jgi:hypothetical protein
MGVLQASPRICGYDDANTPIDEPLKCRIPGHYNNSIIVGIPQSMALLMVLKRIPDLIFFANIKNPKKAL